MMLKQPGAVGHSLALPGSQRQSEARSIFPRSHLKNDCEREYYSKPTRYHNHPEGYAAAGILGKWVEKKYTSSQYIY